jgi:hypothetical protein
VLDLYGIYLFNEDGIDFNLCSRLNSRSRLSPDSPAHDLPEDDGCDLEGMDVHLRETYFATSSERGRWSSPIIPRTKPFISGPVRSYRGQSTPVKSTQNIKSSLLEFREYVRRKSTSRAAEDPLRSPFLSVSDNDIEDYRSSSPLPPSSPLTSPMSLAALLPDDCVSINDDMNLGDDCGSDDVRVCPLISLSQPVIEHLLYSLTSSRKARFRLIQRTFCHAMFPSSIMSAC